MMRPLTTAWVAFTALLQICCALPPDRSGQPRVTEREIQEITPVVYAYISRHHISDTISAFARRPDHSIEVRTDANKLYVIRKFRDTWRIVNVTDYDVDRVEVPPPQIQYLHI